MSTLKVNDIESYTGTSPVNINDSVIFSGSGGGNILSASVGETGGIFIHGTANSASARNSHVEGSHNSVLAGAVGAHAEGYQNSASGQYSHVEGQANSASGDYAHAEGFRTTASYNYSHAEGWGTTTGATYQHVSGKFNQQKANALAVIGNGTAANDRKNIAEFYTGQMVLSGSLIIISGSDTQVTIKTLPTSDPQSVGQLFTTSSTGTGGNIDGTLILCVSNG